jgi:tetratricopeptide (TPR) repeat protein
MLRMSATWLAVLLGAASGSGHAELWQQPDQQQSPPSTPAGSSAPQKKAPSMAPSPDARKYDAYNAEKDIEVATFYMHKGDVDAAIPRLEEAAKLRPNYGKPRLLLADCYERKHDPASALKYYKEYLKVYPNAPDAKKIEKKIDKLETR